LPGIDPRDDIGRIEQTSGVERAIDRNHQIELDLRSVTRHFTEQVLADAMLGTERATHSAPTASASAVLRGRTTHIASPL
jgi:hypothetical protein